MLYTIICIYHTDRQRFHMIYIFATEQNSRLRYVLDEFKIYNPYSMLWPLQIFFLYKSYRMYSKLNGNLCVVFI